MNVLVDIAARALALLWAGFWTYFFIAESTAESTPLRLAAPWLALGILFLVLAFIPWRWRKTGAFLLIGIGLLVGVAYAIWAPQHLHPGVKVLTDVMFAVPPLVAGTLFLLQHRTASYPAG